MTESIVLGTLSVELITFIIVIGVWSLIWKGFALYKAARNESKTWFIVLLVLNTLGILEILYIFYFSKKNTFKKLDKHIDITTDKVKETAHNISENEESDSSE